MVRKDLEEKLIESNILLAESLKGIHDNLKTLNDNNILHAQKSSDEHKDILNTLKTMTDKYWWLIIVLIGILAALAGYKEFLAGFI